MYGYGKGRGKGYYNNRGHGKGYGRGYSDDRWNSNDWNNSSKKSSQNDSTRIDYTPCFHCGDPCHNADSCTRDVYRNKDNVIKDVSFESRRLLEREREHNFFTFGFGDHLKDKFDLTAPSNTKHALLLAGFPATTSPHVFKDIQQRLDNCVSVFPYGAHGFSFVFVSAWAFFKDESTYKHAFHVCNGRQFKVGPPCLIVRRARKSTIKRILRGVNPQIAAERLKISFGKKRRKKDHSSSSSSSESDISDDSLESDSSSSDDSCRRRKGKRDSVKRDDKKKKRAHSPLPRSDSQDENVEADVPSIIAETPDDDGNGVSKEYAQVLVNQSAASPNLKFWAHDEKLDALQGEMDDQKRTV